MRLDHTNAIRRLHGASKPALAALFVGTLGGCNPVRSQLIAMPAPPRDVYRCLQLELARSGYTIVGADAASGWLHAERQVVHFLDPEQAVIYATVISDDEGNGSHLQITDNNASRDDSERMQQRCTSP